MVASGYQKALLHWVLGSNSSTQVSDLGPAILALLYGNAVNFKGFEYKRSRSFGTLPKGLSWLKFNVRN